MGDIQRVTSRREKAFLKRAGLTNKIDWGYGFSAFPPVRQFLDSLRPALEMGFVPGRFKRVESSTSSGYLELIRAGEKVGTIVSRVNKDATRYQLFVQQGYEDHRAPPEIRNDKDITAKKPVQARDCKTLVERCRLPTSVEYHMVFQSLNLPYVLRTAVEMGYTPLNVTVTRDVVMRRRKIITRITGETKEAHLRLAEVSLGREFYRAVITSEELANDSLDLPIFRLYIPVQGPVYEPLERRIGTGPGEIVES